MFSAIANKIYSVLGKEQHARWVRRCTHCHMEFTCQGNCQEDEDYEYRFLHKDTCLCPECLLNYITNEKDELTRKVLIKNLRLIVDRCKRELEFNPSIREIKRC